jgi:hypothetical protein
LTFKPAVITVKQIAHHRNNIADIMAELRQLHKAVPLFYTLPGNAEYRCQLCSKTFNGAKKRAIAHLAGIPREGVDVCTVAPDPATAEHRKIVHQAKAIWQSKYSKSPGTASSSQSAVESMLKTVEIADVG